MPLAKPEHGARLSTGRPSNSSSGNSSAMLIMLPAQTWAICRSTNVTGPRGGAGPRRSPPRRRGRRSRARRTASGDVDLSPLQHVRSATQIDQQHQAVPHPQQAPVLQHRGVVRLATASGRRPALNRPLRAAIGSSSRYASRSSARAAARGVAQVGRLLQAAEGDHLQIAVGRGLSSRGGSGSCSSTSSTVSTGVAAWNGGRPVSIW